LGDGSAGDGFEDVVYGLVCIEKNMKWYIILLNKEF